MDVKKILGQDLLFFDGAMGTALQSRGLKTGSLPEKMNIEAPETVIAIHREHLEAGAQVITTNTFGANELKLAGSGLSAEEVIARAVENARTAIGGKKAWIALDIGPLGELLAPLGTLSFSEAYALFQKQVLQGVRSGVDLILIETMADLYEVKAAVLAAKEHSNLPVFCTMSFDQDQRTFTGCSVESMVLVLEGLGVDALGVNCSLGPKEIEPILERILEISKTPVMVQANAGLPSIVNGKTVFNISPQEFAFYAKKFAEKGTRIIGGCCGTTKKHIRTLTENLSSLKPAKRDCKPLIAVCTPTKVVPINEIRVIGERLNPTGKKSLQKALREENWDYILNEAIIQAEAGAEILDVNVGLPEIDEEKTMVRVIEEIQSILDVPLQIDSAHPRVLEKALRIYNGKAVVNSVTGEAASLEAILPLVKKYGAAVIGLTLDESGIPPRAEDRFKIARKIVQKAQEYGIDKNDVYIDCLTLTAAAQQKEVRETLRALQLVKEKLQVRTVLGVSNVSYGLPNRALLNRTFLAFSLYAGLNLPIIDPLNKEMMDVIAAAKVLQNEDEDARRYIAAQAGGKQEEPVQDVSEDLFKIIVSGRKEQAKEATRRLLLEKEPLTLIDDYIGPALDSVGHKYEKGDLFLPQLIRSAETVKNSFGVIRAALQDQSLALQTKGKIILATVKGDIHDIGKNIVKVLLENYNYEVIDLGRDVPPEKIVEEALKNEVRLIGLSALMTTTVKNMEKTILSLKEACPACAVMVGGAVLNEDYAKMIKADFYASDARGAIPIARKVLG